VSNHAVRGMNAFKDVPHSLSVNLNDLSAASHQLFHLPASQLSNSTNPSNTSNPFFQSSVLSPFFIVLFFLKFVFLCASSWWTITFQLPPKALPQAKHSSKAKPGPNA
jgi:hypothetical protein